MRWIGAHVNPTVCGRRYCTNCGRWRYVVDFASHKRDESGTTFRFNSHCRACVRTLSREAKRNYSYRLKVADYNQAWQEQRRREKGILSREEWQKLNGRGIVLGRTHCSRCGCWRPVSDFPLQKRKGQEPKLGSMCYACSRVASRKFYTERRADPERLAARREYDRIYKEAQRRKAGVPEREWGQHSRRGEMLGAGPRVPVDPLREWLEFVVSREVPDLGRPAGGIGHRESRSRTLEDLAVQLGVNERKLFTLRAHESQKVSVALADRLITKYDQPVLLRSRDLESRLVEWAMSLPGNGTRLLAYLDRAERVAHLADVTVMRLPDLYPELDRD